VNRRAFTLIELLTVIAILGILATILVPVTQAVRGQAKKGREIAGARSLVTGYILSATDNGGQLLAGYGPGPVGSFRGETVTWPTSYRYPFRLSPYLDDVFRGQLFVNEQAYFYDQIVADPSKSTSEVTYDLSLFPSFGLNQYFLGGHHEVGASHGIRPVQRIDQAADETGGLIVFLSSKWSREAEDARGYFQVTSPGFPSKWPGNYSETAPASTFGYVDPRWSGKAVAAMLGGHVELLDMRELRDMRRWALDAVQADDPEWRP